MPPGTHLLISWSVANTVRLDRRDRAFVTLAGVLPDIDGIGYLLDWVHPEGLYFERYHHIIGHNLLFFLSTTALLIFFSRQKWLTLSLLTISFHLHLFCDLIGARGPDNYQWPIPYLVPFSDLWQ